MDSSQAQAPAPRRLVSNRTVIAIVDVSIYTFREGDDDRFGNRLDHHAIRDFFFKWGVSRDLRKRTDHGQFAQVLRSAVIGFADSDEGARPSREPTCDQLTADMEILARAYLFEVFPLRPDPKRHAEPRDHLCSSLELDGYTILSDRLIRPDADHPTLRETHERLNAALRQLGIKEAADLTARLADSEEHFAQGKFIDCLGALRTVHEGAVDGVLALYSDKRTNKWHKRIASHLGMTGPERELLYNICGALSNQGSHALVHDRIRAIAYRQMTVTWVLFVLELAIEKQKRGTMPPRGSEGQAGEGGRE